MSAATDLGRSIGMGDRQQVPLTSAVGTLAYVNLVDGVWTATVTGIFPLPITVPDSRFCTAFLERLPGMVLADTVAEQRVLVVFADGQPVITDTIGA